MKDNLIDRLDTPWVGIPLFIASFALFVGGVVVFIMWIGFHQSAVSCHAWSIYTHRPSRYVQLNWFDRKCLTPQGHGQWIPIDQLRGVAGAP